MSPVRSFLRAVGRLLDSWWSADRIRVSAREGRLLRLQPPAIVTLDGRRIEVVRRTVGQSAEGAFVLYDCQTEAGAAQIRAAIVGTVYSPRVLWIEDAQERVLTDAELECWCPAVWR